ncbi:hypothetical protein DXG01_001503 [Tephrocybe rancida]|nr:hypothetical protein DXG01_001503 [Tephrocybe rancida]
MDIGTTTSREVVDDEEPEDESTSLHAHEDVDVEETEPQADLQLPIRIPTRGRANKHYLQSQVELCPLAHKGGGGGNATQDWELVDPYKGEVFPNVAPPDYLAQNFERKRERDDHGVSPDPVGVINQTL